MAKLFVTAAVVTGALVVLARPASACKDRDRDGDEDEDADRGRSCRRVDLPPGGPVMHIRIHGQILGFGGEAPEPPPPPPLPPTPPAPPAPPALPAIPRPPRAPSPPPPPPAMPATDSVVYAPAPAREAHIGVGVRASALRIGRSGPDAAGVGALLRFRARPVELELEVGRDEYRGDMARSDTRLGAGLYVPLVSGRWVPFLVVGGGVNFSYFAATGDELHQGYLAGGAGLSVRVVDGLVIGADARYMLRDFFDDRMTVAAQPLGGDDPRRDQALELRLSGIVYF